MKTVSTENHSLSQEGAAFGAAHAASYIKSTREKVPGLSALHHMTAMLLGERVPDEGKVLVVGAGGGLEVKALADSHAGWSFCGVDPSADMLKLAEVTLASHSPRVQLLQGYVDSAPDGPFDAAVCLLTLHFVPAAERVRTLREIHARLRSGSPFVVAHISFPQTEPERTLSIDRHLAFGGVSPGNMDNARKSIATGLSVLSPEEDEAMLREAGFHGVGLFYAALTFRGWVAYA